MMTCDCERKTTGKPISVCLLIGSLEFGGAERQVVEMIRSFDRNRVNPIVCSLSHEVPLGSFLPDDGRQLFIVEKRGRFDVTVVLRVAQMLRQRQIDVVHAFHLDAEIVGRLAARLAGVPVVLASERNTDYVRPLLHKIALKATQPLFDVMIANSFAGKRFNMRTLGLRDSRIEVVHNGVDVDRFCADREAGRAFRSQMGIPAEDFVIGMVGSYKRQKGHDRFVRLAAQVRELFPNTTFLVVGEVMRDDSEAGGQYQAEVKQLATALNLRDHCRFIGNQKNMKAVYNACDLTVLLSRREGTPNVILESMACAVPFEDSVNAAALVVRLLRDPAERTQMGEAARRRICEEFSSRKAADRLQGIYERCLARKLGRSHANGSPN